MKLTAFQRKDSAGASGHAAACRRSIGRRRTIGALAAVTVAAAALYLLAFINPRFFEFALSLRVPKLAAMLTAAFAIASASLVFQTIIRNTIVTPCLLGMNSLYVLVHTAVVFFLGTASIAATDPVVSFALDLFVMGGIAYIVYSAVFAKTGGNVLYILLIGTVLSTFFTSVQATLTRIMDPNEYDALLNTLVANFSNVNATVILPAVGILAVIIWWLRRDLAVLDILALGRDQAINLGVDYARTVRRLLLAVALFIAVATALVGPLSFLGLITANISRELFKTYRHGVLIAGSVLIGMVILTVGQFMVEHLAVYSVPVSVFITIGGGAYFLYLILKTGWRRA